MQRNVGVSEEKTHENRFEGSGSANHLPHKDDMGATTACPAVNVKGTASGGVHLDAASDPGDEIEERRHDQGPDKAKQA